MFSPMPTSRKCHAICYRECVTQKDESLTAVSLTPRLLLQSRGLHVNCWRSSSIFSTFCICFLVALLSSWHQRNTMLTSTADLSNSTINTPTSGFEVEANASINRVLTTISGSLSLLGTSLIIGTYIAWKDFRSTSRIILVYVSIADFIVAGSNLVGVWHRHTETGRDVLCEAQSFVTATASLWSFFWTTFLAAFMYMTVAKKQRNKAVIMLKVFHGFGWGIPIIIVGTALGLQKLGNDKDFYTSGWCWINSDLNDEDKHLWMLLTGKAWEIAAYVICSTFYLLLRCHIHKEVMS